MIQIKLKPSEEYIFSLFDISLIDFNNIDFDSVIKSKYSFISAVNSFSIIEQNLTESSFKK